VHCHVARLPDVLRAELQTAFCGDFLALGMLGWEVGEGTMQAKNLLFPWHRDNETLCELFERLCDEGAESVEQEIRPTDQTLAVQKPERRPDGTLLKGSLLVPVPC